MGHGLVLLRFAHVSLEAFPVWAFPVWEFPAFRGAARLAEVTGLNTLWDLHAKFVTSYDFV